MFNQAELLNKKNKVNILFTLIYKKVFYRSLLMNEDLQKSVLTELNINIADDKTLVDESLDLQTQVSVLKNMVLKLKNDLAVEKKLNEEIKVRFVKCNTCTDEMKGKCIMFSENLCEGERCNELVDLMSLVNKE